MAGSRKEEMPIKALELFENREKELKKAGNEKLELRQECHNYLVDPEGKLNSLFKMRCGNH